MIDDSAEKKVYPVLPVPLVDREKAKESRMKPQTWARLRWRLVEAAQ